jgi:uncharacterized membrane protein
MDWATPIVLSWVIEVSTTILLIFGIILMIKGVSRVEGYFKKPVIMLLISLILFDLLGIFRGILIAKKIDYESFLWSVPSIIGFIGALILIGGGKKLLEELNKN